jgi:hypothetical protein
MPSAILIASIINPRLHAGCEIKFSPTAPARRNLCDILHKSPPEAIKLPTCVRNNALFAAKLISAAKRALQLTIGTQRPGPLFLFFKIIFGSAAHRALPVIRYIFELGTGCHAVIRVSLCRIIHIATNRTYVSVHCFSPFMLFDGYLLTFTHRDRIIKAIDKPVSFCKPIAPLLLQNQERPVV